MPTNRRTRPWEPLPRPEQIALRESVERLTRLAVELPFAGTRKEALKIAFCQWTEEGGGSRKTGTRFRSREAVDRPDEKCQHDHVVERAWLSRIAVARPALIPDLLELAVACLVTTAEHKRLTAAKQSFGWERYRDAGVVVLDAAHEFRQVDLVPLFEAQSRERRRIEREVDAVDGRLALRVTDGRAVDLGTEVSLRAAEREIASATGGSSHRGRFSHLFALQAEEIQPDIAARLAEEALEFQDLFADSLSRPTRDLLSRLGELSPGDGA